MVWLNPYVINGAAHSAALFRRQAQRPASANSGVAEPTDLAVVKLPSAGPGFRIMPGSLSLKSGYSGRSRESYGVENGDSAIDITGVEGTGSAARRDAVVVEVLDPNYMPITHEEAALENYTRVHVVQNVPASAKNINGVPGFTNRTAYVLAFINWPKEQTAIQTSYIEDARQLANPRRDEVAFGRPRVAADGGAQEYLTALYSNGGEYFPGGDGSPNKFTVDVPEWATRMMVDASWMAVIATGTPHGRYWIEYGDEYRDHTWPNKQQYEFATQQFAFNYPATTDEKTMPWHLMDEVPVPAKLRGKTISVVFKAGRTSAFAAQHKVWMNALGGLGCKLTFAERAAGPDMV